MSLKKILIILGVIVLVGVLGFLVYYFVLRPAPVVIAPPPAVFPPIANVPIGLPPAIERPPAAVSPEEAVTVVPPEVLAPAIPPTVVSNIAGGGLTKVDTLTDKPVYNTALSGDGKNLNYYDKTTGKFYQITPDGKTKTLSERTFYDVENVTWSPNKNETILEYPDGSNVLYNFDTDKMVTLPKHWEDFDFSTNNDQIIFKSLAIDPEDRWLAVSTPDGSGSQLIEHLGNNEAKVDVAWAPNNQIVATFTESIGLDRQELYFVGLHGENFKLTVLEGHGFEGQWTPQGDRMLYSVYSSETDYNPRLWIVDALGDNIGNNRTPLNVETWANKCTFASDNVSLYCAVPRELQTGSGIIPQVADDVPDDFYLINTQTGSKTFLANTEADYTVDQMMLSEDGSYLYFIDKQTNTVHKIQLK